MPYEPERITVDAESVTIRWTDGAATTIGGDMLRSSCPCAECLEYETKTRSIIESDNRSSIVDARSAAMRSASHSATAMPMGSTPTGFSANWEASSPGRLRRRTEH